MVRVMHQSLFWVALLGSFSCLFVSFGLCFVLLGAFLRGAYFGYFFFYEDSMKNIHSVFLLHL